MIYSCELIIDEKIGWGVYHKRLFLIVGLILLADGSEA